MRQQASLQDQPPQRKGEPNKAGAVGATQQLQQESEVQGQRKRKLPPYFNGEYYNYEDWRFDLQACLWLIDKEPDTIPTPLRCGYEPS